MATPTALRVGSLREIMDMRRLVKVERGGVRGTVAASAPAPASRPARFPSGTQEVAPLGDHAQIEDEVAQIAHDLKSPLSAIALEATLLDDRLLYDDRVASVRSVIRIQQNVAYL